MTVIAQVERDHREALGAVLATIRAAPATNPVLTLATFPQLHFASFVLFDDAELGPLLVFESNVDGSLDEWLAALVVDPAADLGALYRHCVGYPTGASSAEVLRYLRNRAVRPGAYHIGATGRSVARIRQEAALREAIDRFLDAEHEALAVQAPASVRAAIQEFVRGCPEFSWARTFPPRETLSERLGHRAKAVLSLIPVIVALPVVVPGLALWFVVLRAKERTDPVRSGPADPEHVRELVEAEDVVAQNHLASVIPVKPGAFRQVTLRVVLYVLNLVARITATKGELGGIPSIHFAHWSMVAGGRRLLFLSNYDGSWESYLDDFIEKAATGLTAVWSNSVEFPRTRGLVGEGARDGPRFKHWARASQCPTTAWYSAYERSTMSTIDNNSAIREDLFGPLDEAETRAWLQRF